MGRNKFTFLVYVILGLAGIGLITQLFGNTKNFLANVFVMIGMGLAVFAVIYFIFLRKRPGSNSEMKKYRKAVKQSKTKYKMHQDKNYKKKSPIQAKQKRRMSKRPSHLRVIDGKKEKDRATY
ncbi:SA1362 family protein [Virgibacillus sp. W0181]|uniref:SA1362 family protein n=1 Tax=Virgibacillus sp. W0181 TaxID=3391581 RepID=UPI003F48A741